MNVFPAQWRAARALVDRSQLEMATADQNSPVRQRSSACFAGVDVPISASLPNHGRS
jgi:hypothetical protein